MKSESNIIATVRNRSDDNIPKNKNNENENVLFDLAKGGDGKVDITGSGRKPYCAMIKMSRVAGESSTSSTTSSSTSTATGNPKTDMKINMKLNKKMNMKTSTRYLSVEDLELFSRRDSNLSEGTSLQNSVILKIW